MQPYTTIWNLYKRNQFTNAFHGRYLIQTYDVEFEFSKVFTEYIKNIQHQISQRANSIFTNDVFSLTYSFLSILDTSESQRDSPIQTSQHTTVRQEIGIFSELLNAIRENLTSNEITQHVDVEHDLQKTLAWFIIDYFAHNIDLISRARTNFRPQDTDDETVLAEQTEYVWYPEWSHTLFVNIPTDISSQAINLFSIHKNYIKIYPIAVDATPLNYNSFFPDRAGNNSPNSTFIEQENLNGTRNLSQQDIQTPSHFVGEEIVETITTTAQQSISPIHTRPKTLCCSKILTYGLPNI